VIEFLLLEVQMVEFLVEGVLPGTEILEEMVLQDMEILAYSNFHQLNFHKRYHFH
jgi:hypothetical protein